MPAQIYHAYKEPRKAAITIFENYHYLRKGPGQAVIGVVEEEDGSISGACAIGEPNSPSVPPAISTGIHVFALKRLCCLPSCSMTESALMRATMSFAMRFYTNKRAEQGLAPEPAFLISYADEDAYNKETGVKLRGFVNMAAGLMLLDQTKKGGAVVFDPNGDWHSTRNGGTTFSKSSLPEGWEMVPGGVKQRWITLMLPPDLSRRAQQRLWVQGWSHLNPERRVAFRDWIDDPTWRRGVATGNVISLHTPTKVRFKSGYVATVTTMDDGTLLFFDPSTGEQAHVCPASGRPLREEWISQRRQGVQAHPLVLPVSRAARPIVPLVLNLDQLDMFAEEALESPARCGYRPRELFEQRRHAKAA